MARVSRPPGFDMVYRPKASETFGPPASTYIPSLVYLIIAVALGTLVGVAQVSASSPSSTLFRYITDPNRPFGAKSLAVVVFVSALASLLRARMRGVVVHPDGLETRDVVVAGWPKVRRFAWAQIDRIVLDGGQSIGLDLWDGRREWLPKVGERARLAHALERVASARAIPVSGGSGVFDPPEED
jgi:hypothetical protein